MNWYVKRGYWFPFIRLHCKLVLSVSMTPVMYSDISGYAPEWIKGIPIVGAVIEKIGLAVFTIAVSTGVAIASVLYVVASALAISHVNHERTKYARVVYGDNISNYEIAKNCIDQHVKFEIYEHVAVSTDVVNFFTTSAYILTSYYKVSSLFGKDLKPGHSLFIDMNVNDDARNFVYSERFSNFSESEKLELYEYYIERHTFWKENYYD